MTDRPRAFVELCCGSAAVTLRLLGGPAAVPPISYMGSKRGISGTILAAMGLRSGIGADRVLLCDNGPWAHVWSVLAQPGARAEVAAILRGWADEDPRALWERLREAHRGEWEGWTAERAAGWLYSTRCTHGQGSAGGFAVGPGDNTRFDGGSPQASIAARITSTAPLLSPPPAVVAGPAEGVDPAGVAAWLQVGALSMRGEVEAGFEDAMARFERGGRGHPTNGAERTAARLASLPLSDASVYAGPAEHLHPIPPLDGVYVFCDPPYSGDGTRKITGYAATMPRSVVVEVANRWSKAGAVVCVSECVGLAGEFEGDWWEVDITGERVGQRRTFSRQSTEIITLNRPPAFVPAVQAEMFGS